ncbi:MAG TPA: alpha-glucuronidase family glycosyl hydrolase, partial [Blastocatellia bacterium]|nr:alpha-glucuronidase family glycosyl hydrolase [Blastocatellia bacterium]
MMTYRIHRQSVFLIIAVLFLSAMEARAEDGYRLWLRYDPLPRPSLDIYRSRVTAVVTPGGSATLDAIRTELVEGCSGLLGRRIPVATDADRDGAVIVGTPKRSPLIAGLKWERQLAELGPEGFWIRSMKIGTRAVTVIASEGEVGALYGAFHFLRLMQTLQPIDNLDVRQRPRMRLRVLNHWDNLDGTIERGYAGRSLWDWESLPEKPDPRLRDYARANASVGINGAVLNNVNANARSLSTEYLRKTAAIAEVFRPFGVRVYLSARFSAPIELGGLKTADPLNPEV